jgi:putative transposase
MKRSKFTETLKTSTLRQVDEGRLVQDGYRNAGVSIQTSYRQREKYGGLMPTEMTRLTQLDGFAAGRASTWARRLRETCLCR